MAIMKTLTIDGKTYEVVDEAARSAVESHSHTAEEVGAVSNVVVTSNAGNNPGSWAAIQALRNEKLVRFQFQNNANAPYNLLLFSSTDNGATWTQEGTYDLTKLATTDYAVNKAGDTMTGTLVTECNSPTHTFLDTGRGDECMLSTFSNQLQIKKRNVKGDDTNYRRLVLKDSTSSSNVKSALVLGDKVNGSETYYDILHTGNISQYVSSGMQMDLLWTNASPTSQFAAQTVSLNLSSYGMVAVQIVFTGDSPLYSPLCFANIGVECSASVIANWDADKTAVRSFTASSTGVAFGAGGYHDFGNKSFTGNNSYAIPVKIYGIKGVS